MTRVETWQRSASCYEASWAPVTGRFAPSLLDAVGAGPGTRLLDLACGPGTVAIAALKRGAHVVGADASSAMARLASRRSDRSLFATGDAERPPFAPTAFDAVAINFGVHHFADPALALAAVAELLRPNGRLGYTVWAASDENPALRAIDEAFAAIAPPEPARDFPFGDAGRYRGALIELGYAAAGLELARVERHWRPERVEDVFEAELKGGGRKTELLARQNDAGREAIRSRVTEIASRFERSEGIAIPMIAYVISARRSTHPDEERAP